MSDEIQPIGSDALTDIIDQKLAKLPFKTITVRPSVQLRMRIVAIAQKLNISAREVLERLVATAAGLKIAWVLVQPQNGPEAGIAFAQVEKVLVKVFNLLNEAAGTFYRVNANQQAKQIEAIREGCVTLWVASQNLAKETFFDPEEFKAMCECHDFTSENIKWLRKQVEDEKADQQKLANLKKRLKGYETTQRVLKRLGCGGAHDAL